jgi:tetratricopeptide (TPR) repeat protein
VLTGLEEAPERLWRCAHLNVQRNQLAKRFPVPWVMLVHPSAAFDLAMHAPDFIDFAGLRMREETTERFERALELAADPYLQAALLVDIARIRTTKGDVDAALALHQEALKVCEDLGDRRSYALALGEIARIQTSKGEVDIALALHEEELKAYDPWGSALARGGAWRHSAHPPD